MKECNLVVQINPSVGPPHAGSSGAPGAGGGMWWLGDSSWWESLGLWTQWSTASALGAARCETHPYAVCLVLGLTCLIDVWQWDHLENVPLENAQICPT